MRLGWFGQALQVRLLAGAAAALLLALVGGCSEHNEGNVTAAPPHTDPVVAAGGNSSGGKPSGSGGSVIPGGGSSSGGGSSTDVTKPWPSTGCGMDLPPEQVSTIPGSRTGYTEFKVMQTGATLAEDDPTNAGERQFFVRVPYDYDNTRPYRVVYIGQGCGAQHAGKTNTYPLFNEMQGGTEQAVYVGVSVPDNGKNPGCYDNNTGDKSQEWEAFDLMHTFVESHYCVDNNRVYVAGYSTGGWLSNMYGCYFGGTPSPPLDAADLAAGRTERKFSPKWAIRGHANVTGSLPPNQPQPCNGPSAGFWIHDALDTSNKIATNIAALNLSLKTNGCQGDYAAGPKKPWAPAENIAGLKGGICQEYTGCPADVAAKYPLVFCTTSGLGHGDQASSAIPAFTTFFNLMDPQ
jgi:poly(3-hydroxybutyrate) depolymerase